MKARTRFRAATRPVLRDEDAAAIGIGAGRKQHAATEEEDAAFKAQDKEKTARLIARIAELQTMLYAGRRHKVLLILQGMDTSGKDGTVRALFSQVNPVGIRVAAFKAPSDFELAHDYLWRVHQQVPVKGEIAIFNRSHYEDVLITVVQGMIDKPECKRRYAQIRDFERMLADTGTVIVKICLHISKDEQRTRLQARLQDPSKQWKFDPNDLVQRKQWPAYQSAYARAIRATDADHAPWYVVPADSKTQRDLAIAAIVCETLESLKLDWPPVDPELSKLVVV
ncbi:polyphosphate kinase 2 family protein [Oxalobacteraceae bacterium]|nr:polyphosphate kinase 2 family protein [Oxalobacteraceae bacterium]